MAMPFFKADHFINCNNGFRSYFKIFRIVAARSVCPVFWRLDVITHVVIEHLPLGCFGMKFNVRSLHLKCSPDPSIQMYVARILSAGIGRSLYLPNRVLDSTALGELASTGPDIIFGLSVN